MQRNNISKLDAKTRRDIALWLCDGLGPKAIRERLAKMGVKPIPHNSSFKTYRNSAEFKKIYERQMQLTGEVVEAETDWKIAEGAGANGYAATAVFETLRDLRKEYKEAEDLASKVRLAETINTISRTFAGAAEGKLKEFDREFKRQQKLKETALQEALTEKDALIATLTEELEAKAKATGKAAAITPAVIAQIKQIYGIKPVEKVEQTFLSAPSTK